MWWFGHSGYEYIDLGRFFQIALLIGLVLWVILVARALWPALKRRDAQRPLLVMLLISTIAIVLFTVKSLHPNLVWPERLLKTAFWAINLGLGAMVLFSLLPVGLLQTWAAVAKGYWYARSAEFLHTPLMSTLRWFRVFGDTLFAVGAVAFVIAVAKLTRRTAAAASVPLQAATPAA